MLDRLSVAPRENGKAPLSAGTVRAVTIALLLQMGAVFGQAEEPSTPVAGKNAVVNKKETMQWSEEHIAHLITQLGDQKYLVREQAMKQLDATMNESLYETVRMQMWNTDAEISTRATKLVKKHFDEFFAHKRQKYTVQKPANYKDFPNIDWIDKALIPDDIWNNVYQPLMITRWKAQLIVPRIAFFFSYPSNPETTIQLCDAWVDHVFRESVMHKNPDAFMAEHHKKIDAVLQHLILKQEKARKEYSLESLLIPERNRRTEKQREPELLVHPQKISN